MDDDALKTRSIIYFIAETRLLFALSKFLATHLTWEPCLKVKARQCCHSVVTEKYLQQIS